MVASCWLFLSNLYYDARIHEHQVYLDIVCTDSRGQYELEIFHNEDAFASWDNGLSRSAGDFPLICHFH